MDQKQKNLSPELKAVYDRVMNTKISARPSDPPTQTASTSNVTSPKPIISTAPPANNPYLKTEVLPSEPQAPVPSAQQTPYANQPTSAPTEHQTASTATEEKPPPSAPDLSPIEPAADQSGTFLSSLPPRPLNAISQEPFVFTGGKSSSVSSSPSPASSNTKTDSQPQPSTSGNKLSSKIIIGLLVIFLIVYSVFWAKIFNIF